MHRSPSFASIPKKAWRYQVSLVAFILLVSLWLAPSTFAQQRPEGPPPGPPSPEQIKAHMTSDLETVLEKLALSEEKTRQVRPILEADIQKRLEHLGTDREQHHAAMQKIGGETNAALATVLSESEMDRYQQIRDALRAQRPRPPRRKEGSPQQDQHNN